MIDSGRKPRIALMGEFSAGKSTLSNLLLGARPLPEKVTATRLSPVWMSYGTTEPYRVDVDGHHEPVQLEQLEGIDVEATRAIRLFFEADILEVCDLIDFPGISDPNMSSDVWGRMLTEVDAVLWCTHATQAWRQSEAAVWETIPDAVREKSVLLITRFDKLTTERDRYRVRARLAKETQGLFGGIFPISLTQALAAGEDIEAFEASGGGAFLEHLIPLIDDLSAKTATMGQSIYAAAMGLEPSYEFVDAPAPVEAEPLDVVAQQIDAPSPAEAGLLAEFDTLDTSQDEEDRVGLDLAAFTNEVATDHIAEPEGRSLSDHVSELVKATEAPGSREMAQTRFSSLDLSQFGAVEERHDDLPAEPEQVEKPAALHHFAASLVSKDAQPDTPQDPPKGATEGALLGAVGPAKPKRILPRRIRTDGDGTRSLRPVSAGKVVDMTAERTRVPKERQSVEKTTQLRSIFNEKPAP